ncbi:unnamed protein product, partial [Penicillium discolor]
MHSWPRRASGGWSTSAAIRPRSRGSPGTTPEIRRPDAILTRRAPSTTPARSSLPPAAPLFRAIVELAAAHGLPVVAHAEGPGEAQRVVRLGASQLAHAPFTERLDDEEIAEQAVRASWISTLAIHDPAARAIAIDNAARFHAAGGTVRYGTDMGN